MLPEEDKDLCKHNWVEVYNAGGPDRQDPDILHCYFFCEKCLMTRYLVMPQNRIKLRKDFLEGNDDFNNGVANR